MADTCTLGPDLKIARHSKQASELEVGSLKIGLVDFHCLSRECLANAIEKHDSSIELFQFPSIHHLISEDCSGLDLVIYHPHSRDSSDEVIACDVSTTHRALPDLPIVVLSDVEEADQPKTIRSTLNSGARGFIPTRTTGIPIVVAAIRFVKAGGTFAPIDQLLANQTAHTSIISYTEPQVPLTARQMAVLSHLRQGKANKIIAYELNMSESTVKVHIRNIMRRMGATNRTQAAYKAQQLWNSVESNGASNL